MLNYARVYVLCATIARIQKRPSSEVLADPESDAVLGLWKSLVEIIMGQMAWLVNESAYRCQLTWAPTYPALTIAFISRFPFLCPSAGTNLASNIRSSSGTVASGFDRSKLGLAASATNQRDSETTALSRYPSHRVHILQLCQCAFCRKKLCDQSRYCNVEYCRTLDTTKTGCRQSEV